MDKEISATSEGFEASDAMALAEIAKTYWSDIYRSAKEDTEFSIGLNQWDEDTITARKSKGMPCLTVPILPQFIHQVVNDIKQNTPSIEVSPIGGGADIETAKIIKGLIRDIQYKSSADTAYDTAADCSVRGGFGFIRVDHDYCRDGSGYQELKIKRIQNPQAVYLDPSSVEIDGSDAEWGFILDTLKVKDFKKKYPGREIVSFESANTTKKEDEIVIAEFFRRELQEDKTYKVLHQRFSGEGKPLEETSFPGQYIPIVPVVGEEVWVDGKRHWLSLIRQAKDAQRRVNFWASKETEILAKAATATVMAAVGQIERGTGWEGPGGHNVLEYNVEDAEGNKPGAPVQLNAHPVPTGIVNAFMNAKESVKESLGLYNASIGNKSNETSGVAINARKVEGEVATYHFADNLNKAIQHVGRIIVSAMAEVYDTARVLQIVDDEEEQQTISVNGAPKQPGQKQDFDLRTGQYHVRVTTGASYTTKRQEAATLLGEVIKASPELMGVIGDLYFKNLDVAGAEAIAERVKKTINPALLEGENGEQAPDPEKLQMQQMIEQMQMQMQQMAAELQSKQAEQQVKMGELAIKQEEVNVKKAEVGIKEADMKLKYLTALQGNGENKEAAPSAPAQPIAAPDDSIEVLQVKIQQKILEQQEQQALAQQEQAMLAMQAQAQSEQEARENELKLADMQAREQQATALVNLLSSIAQSLEQQTELTARQLEISQQPLEVIRNENGVIVGAN
jgi:hypothetical protein